MRNDRRLIVPALFWTAVFAAGILYMRHLGLTDRQSVLLGVLALLSLAMHLFAERSDPLHTKRALALSRPEGQGRTPEYDHLRLIALCFVILLHAVQADEHYGLIAEGIPRRLAEVCLIVLFSCNQIYVLLSGALLLPWREEPLSRFYLRRFPKILIPMLTFFLWGLWQDGGIRATGLREILRRLYTGEVLVAPHYWLIYTILGLYAAFPFLRHLLRGMSYRRLTALIGISLLFQGISCWSPLPFAVPGYLSGWVGVAFLGFWLTREETRKYDPLLILSGFLALAAGAVCVFQGMDATSFAVNLSPISSMVSCGIVAAVLRCPRLFSREGYPVRLLSRCSFPMLLIHWWTLHFVALRLAYGHGVHTASGFGLGALFILALTLAVSFAVSFFLENLLCFPLFQCQSALMDRPWRRK